MGSKLDLEETVEKILVELREIKNELQLPRSTIAKPLTTQQLMTYMTASRRTVQSWRDKGLIEFSSIKGKLYYEVSAIKQMLKEHRQTRTVNEKKIIT
jgi:hypothetical protein